MLRPRRLPTLLLPILLLACLCGPLSCEPQQQQPPPCVQPRINAPLLARHQGGSLILTDVCLDGNAIVVHDTKVLDALQAGDGQGLPSFDVQRFKEFVKHYTHNPHPLRPIVGSECQHDRLRFRYPTALEVRRAKHFSSCTVPVLIFQHWLHAFGEFFTRGPAWLWRLIVQQQVLDKEVTLVLGSCGSVPLGLHHYQLMQPFSNHQVTSWTAFSSRASSHSHSNSTAEGTHTRCFSKMVVLGMDYAAWSDTYRMAQYVLGYYKTKGLVPEGKLFTSGPQTLKILFEYRAAKGPGHLGAARPHNTQPLPPDHPDVEQLRKSPLVKEPEEFKGRQVYPGVRQILNLADVLEECSKYTGWSDVLNGTIWTGVECQAYSFGRDLFEGMAVAQQADVFISLHGSGEMNAMFMRENTMKIQLRSKEFGTVHRWMANGYWPMVCHQSAFPFLCYFMNMDEDDTWEPGILERFGLFSEGTQESFNRRDRHLRLKFQHLVYALKQWLPLQNDRAAYSKRWESSQVALTFNANNTITYFQQISRKAAQRQRRILSKARSAAEGGAVTRRGSGAQGDDAHDDGQHRVGDGQHSVDGKHRDDDDQHRGDDGQRHDDDGKHLGGRPCDGPELSASAVEGTVDQRQRQGLEGHAAVWVQEEEVDRRLSALPVSLQG